MKKKIIGEMLTSVIQVGLERGRQKESEKRGRGGNEVEVELSITPDEGFFTPLAVNR